MEAVMKKHFYMIIAIVLCIFCLTACGGKKEEAPSASKAPQTQPKTATVDPALIGTWEETDVPEDQKLGDFWTFNEDGTGVYGLMDVTIDYSATGGKLHFSCDFGEYDYTYSIDGDILTLAEEGSSENKYKKAK